MYYEKVLSGKATVKRKACMVDLQQINHLYLADYETHAYECYKHPSLFSKKCCFNLVLLVTWNIFSYWEIAAMDCFWHSAKNCLKKIVRKT